MRFDDVSARYGEFGPFFTGLVLEPARRARRGRDVMSAGESVRLYVSFPEELVDRPMIYEIVKEFDVVPNIRRAGDRGARGLGDPGAHRTVRRARRGDRVPRGSRLHGQPHGRRCPRGLTPATSCRPTRRRLAGSPSWSRPEPRSSPASRVRRPAGRSRTWSASWTRGVARAGTRGRVRLTPRPPRAGPRPSASVESLQVLLRLDPGRAAVDPARARPDPVPRAHRGARRGRRAGRRPGPVRRAVLARGPLRPGAGDPRRPRRSRPRPAAPRLGDGEGGGPAGPRPPHSP